MRSITPSILAENPHTYRAQLERIEAFAKRIHIDLSDGVFSPTITVSPVNIYWPDSIKADLHVMYDDPVNNIEALIDLRPNLVILHAESKGELLTMFNELNASGIRSGLAILPATSVESVSQLVGEADHVLLFGGKLGAFGGLPDLKLLSKVAEVRAINPHTEIGWDGGVNDQNVEQIVEAGIDVVTVGGFIQKAKKPQEAYAILGQKIY